jgi:hypothetical protein
MFYEKKKVLRSDASINSIYNCLKGMNDALNEYYSNFIVADTSDNCIRITDTDNNNILEIGANSTYSNAIQDTEFKLSIYRNVGTVGTIQQSGNTANYGSIRFLYNIPTELILINSTTFAMTLGPLNEMTTPGVKKPGLIVITKTAKGNIAVIQPSYMLGIGKNIDDNPNGLSCLTRASTGESYAFTSILYESDLAYKTVISPVMVNGDSDYCKDVFWVPMIQFNVERGDDAILEIAGEYYYYNGFLACKIGK